MALLGRPIFLFSFQNVACVVLFLGLAFGQSVVADWASFQFRSVNIGQISKVRFIFYIEVQQSSMNKHLATVGMKNSLLVE